jgi:NNP family nitrate/nitrite transporter-like MFS transporter
MAKANGTVTQATDSKIVVTTPKGKEWTYPVKRKEGELVSDQERRKGLLVWPRGMSWQEPVVKEGDKVHRKELVARGQTHIFFQANVWIFTILSLILGAVMGIGKAAVYKHIPDYFPDDVGVVGGIVGVLGGLGGFFCPVIFGYLLKGTGIWTTCWMFFFGLTAVCLAWMHIVVRRITRERTPEIADKLE